MRQPKFFLALYFLSLLSASVAALAERNPELPPPFATPSTPNPSKVVGWAPGQMPVAPAGYEVSVFAELESPRSLYQAPNGDVFVSQALYNPFEPNIPSPNKITRIKLKGSEFDESAVFLSGLTLPFGMAMTRNYFFVGEPTRVLRYDLVDGKISNPDKPTVIAELPFPPPAHHWTRHLLLNNSGTKLYVTVGSASNVGDGGDPLDPREAAVLKMNLDGSQQEILASGLRNPVQLAWEPFSKKLWVTVNERDELGGKLVPDYITDIQKGGFYGWPYAYWGRHEDPRRRGERSDLVARSLTPAFSVGAHTAALGITFTGKKMPAPFAGGALISLHGSWNSSSLVGYKVRFVQFRNGRAVDQERDFLTGFISDPAKSEVYGRPVATLVLKDGTVLVSDDAGNRIWRISPSHRNLPRN
jgi:glucose/arabinose dehydrogenase